MKTAYLLQWAAGLYSILLPSLIKQNPRKIVLTSFHGDGYRGNTKILFEKLVNHPELQAVWLSRNKSIVNELKKSYGEKYAALTHSSHGLKEIASASVLLFTHGTSDFPFVKLPRRAFKIQTYHGLPTKRGEYMRPKSDKRPGYFHRLILNYRFSSINCFLSTSPFVSDIFSKRFNLPDEVLAETGFPAYDLLINSKSNKSLIRKLWPDVPEFEIVILYSPTFRKLSNTRWFPFDDFEQKKFRAFLEKKKALLLFRAHPNENFSLDNFTELGPRCLNAGQNHVEDIYELLLTTDVILTDYSSIYLEGLLRDIPSIFIPYDFETYERGFPFDYKKLTPGDKVDSLAELMNALQVIFSDKENYYQKERAQVKDLFFADKSGRATDNVINLLENTVLKKS
ncbi:MAG: hypothetical protein EA391_05320 [Balneolaceae bacterium]|nr:MAG: hypothetical protein EA391_05320 [Balneolaceae bacterium]